MSLLSDYEQRTAWKYDPVRGLFHTHAGLVNKVNPDGSYTPFSGSTVVFKPKTNCLRLIQQIQSMLYQKLDDSGMLASFLPASTIHMTLHDLISPEMCTAASEDEYRYEISESLNKAAAIIEEIRRDYAGREITLVPDRIVNMVSKSLVLLLRPQTEQNYELLEEMYHRFDSIQNLPYPFTPHITLAYYKPGILDGDMLWKAVEFAQIRPENTLLFEFSPDGLTAQRFLDMQSYMDIPCEDYVDED